jgi:hypothetical protein
VHHSLGAIPSVVIHGTQGFGCKASARSASTTRTTITPSPSRLIGKVSDYRTSARLIGQLSASERRDDQTSRHRRTFIGTIGERLGKPSCDQVSLASGPPMHVQRIKWSTQEKPHGPNLPTSNRSSTLPEASINHSLANILWLDSSSRSFQYPSNLARESLVSSVARDRTNIRTSLLFGEYQAPQLEAHLTCLLRSSLTVRASPKYAPRSRRRKQPAYAVLRTPPCYNSDHTLPTHCRIPLMTRPADSA